MRLIVTSQLDIVGIHVYKALSKYFSSHGEFEGKTLYIKDDVWLISTKAWQTEAKHLDLFFDPEYYVFASRHSSASKGKTLTVHAPGNLSGEARLGGRPYELAYCNADAMKVALIELQKGKEELNLDYQVSLESTHHGPTELKKPVLFVEVGSTIDEWNDLDAINIAARATLRAAENRDVFKKALGIGGGHYAPLHSKVVLASDLAIGHIIPSYSIEEILDNTLRQAMEKSSARFAYLDWKGMKPAERSKITEMASRIGLELKRGRDLKPPTEILEGYRKYSLPSDFINEVERVSKEELKQVFMELDAVVRYEKDGRIKNVFLAREDIRDILVRRCIQILRRKYVVREDWEKGILFLTETKFDPDRAIKLGLKPGPIFGELTRGKTIKFSGREVTPEMVQKKVEKIVVFREGAMVPSNVRD
jgi:D-aminoacyl-tRNA deacylase